MSSVACDWQKQLQDLGKPHKKRAAVIDKVLERLRDENPRRWLSPKARGRIERFLQGRQTPKEPELKDVRIAHARIVPQLMVANNAENQALVTDLRALVETALRADPEFYSAEIETARAIVRAVGQLVDRPRPDDGAH